jgi:hypothetical protein
MYRAPKISFSQHSHHSRTLLKHDFHAYYVRSIFEKTFVMEPEYLRHVEKKLIPAPWSEHPYTRPSKEDVSKVLKEKLQVIKSNR